MHEVNRELAKKVLEVVDAGLCKGVGEPFPGEMCIEAAVCFAMGIKHSDEPPCVSPAVRALKIQLNDSCWSSKESRAKGMRRLAIAQLGSKGAVDDQEFAKLVSVIAVSKIAPRALRRAAELHPDKTHQEFLRKATDECEASQSESAESAARAWSAAIAASAAESAAWSAAARAASAAASAAWSAAWSAESAAIAASAASAAWSAAWSAESAASAARAAASAARAANKDAEFAFFAEEVVQVLIRLKSPGCEWLDLTEENK